MAEGRKQHDERARRFAAALASLCRAQAGLPLAAVAEEAQCLSHARELLALLGSEKPAHGVRKGAGRHPVHDRAWTHSCLLDIALADPDGMPSQAKLIRGLEQRFEAAGRTVPGETWMKAAVREFQSEAREFELEAAITYDNAPALRAVFPNVTEFLRFRRFKVHAARTWAEKPELRSQFASPEKLLEAAFCKDIPPNREPSISAHSRLPVRRAVRSTR